MFVASHRSLLLFVVPLALLVLVLDLLLFFVYCCLLRPRLCLSLGRFYPRRFALVVDVVRRALVAVRLVRDL